MAKTISAPEALYVRAFLCCNCCSLGSLGLRIRQLAHPTTNTAANTTGGDINNLRQSQRC